MFYKIGILFIKFGLKMVPGYGVVGGEIGFNSGVKEKLIAKWHHRARRLFWDAHKDKSMITATRAMEHDAIIYVNCARELKEALT